MMAKEKTHLIRVFPSLKSDHKIRDEFYKALDKRIDWSTISDDAQIPTFFLINRTQTRMIDGLEEQITNHIPELSVKDQYHLFLFLQNVTPVPITANLSYKIKATYQIIWGDDTSRCLENEKMFDDLAATLIMDCGWKVKFCEHLKETYLNYGKDLELEAKIALPLSLDAKWMLNKKSVSKRAEIYQHDGFYGLKIQGVEPSDCGKYSLQIGNSEEEVEIYVKGKMGPSNIQIHQGYISCLTLTWEPPKTDAIHLVTGYTIEWKKDGGIFLVVGYTYNCQMTTFTVHGVEEGTEHQFKVTTNLNGSSENSAVMKWSQRKECIPDILKSFVNPWLVGGKTLWSRIWAGFLRVMILLSCMKKVEVTKEALKKQLQQLTPDMQEKIETKFNIHPGDLPRIIRQQIPLVRDKKEDHDGDSDETKRLLPKVPKKRKTKVDA